MNTVNYDFEFNEENFEEICDNYAHNQEELIIPIGYRDNLILYENYNTIPSTLIVGMTGSGKTSFVKTEIIELMRSYSPQQIQFLIFDSRGIDYNCFNKNPFILKQTIINDLQKAERIISWVLYESRLRLNNIQDIDSQPHLFLILDDFAEMHLSNDSYSDLIQILQIARRIRVHIWIITSTPSSNILPTDLNANIVQRIVFKVTSRKSSQMLLNDSGADTLNIPGEIIVKLNNESQRCNAIFLDEGYIRYYAQRAVEKYGTIILAKENLDFHTDIDHSRIFEEELRDELYQKAVDFVIEMRQASVYMIQNKFKLGYSRAARMIDMMEEDGIVGPYEGAKPRTVLVQEPIYSMENNTTKKINLTRQEIKDGIWNIIVETNIIVINKNDIEHKIYKTEIIDATRIKGLKQKRTNFYENGYILIEYLDILSLADIKSYKITFNKRSEKIFVNFLHQLSNDLKIQVEEIK